LRILVSLFGAGLENMSKIRINELARELEVKPNVILDLLPELGVGDKKTHSSSLDDDVALAIRRRVLGEDAAIESIARSTPEPFEEKISPAAEPMHEPAAAQPAPAASTTKVESAPAAEAVAPAKEAPQPVAAAPRPIQPLRPPLASGSPIV